MAPEIVNKTPYDYRVDIWSLGILLYELLHREAPYKGRSLPEITRSLNRRTFSVSDSVNPAAGHLIHRILKLDPSERPSMQEIFEHPWVKYHLASYKGNQLPTSSTTSRSQELRSLQLNTVTSTEIPSQVISQETKKDTFNEKLHSRISPLKINLPTSPKCSSITSLDKFCSSGNLTSRKLELSTNKDFSSIMELKGFPSTTTHSKQTFATSEDKATMLSPNFRRYFTEIREQASSNKNVQTPSYTSISTTHKTNTFAKVASPTSMQSLGRDDSKSNITSSVSGESTGPTTPLNANFQTPKHHLDSFKISAKVDLPKIRNLYGSQTRKAESIDQKYLKLFKSFGTQKCVGPAPKR